MSAKQRTCYTILCDGCEYEFETGDYTPHFDDVQTGLDEVRESEWTVTRDSKVYCYGCWRAGKSPKCECANEDDCTEQDCVPGCPCQLHPQIEPDGPCADCGEVFERQAQLSWHRYKDHPAVTP